MWSGRSENVPWERPPLHFLLRCFNCQASSPSRWRVLTGSSGCVPSWQKETFVLTVPAGVPGLTCIRQGWVPCRLSLSNNSDREPSSLYSLARGCWRQFVCINLFGP